MSTPSDGPIPTNNGQNKTPKSSKAAKNAAAGAHQKSTARKGANGVLLKKFESVMCDMFSTPTSSKNEVSQEALQHLTPRYSKLPPFLNDMEQQELIENAKVHWKNKSLVPSDTPDIVVNSHSSPWPFDSRTSLPQCGCVRGENSQNKTMKTKTGKDIGGQGSIHNNERAWRKEMQLANMIQCVLALLPDDVRHPEAYNGSGTNANRTFRIVDFAGGTGHLAVPLALLLPHCEVICLDLKKWSLDLMHRRVDGTLNEDNDMTNKNAHDNSHKLPCQSNNVQTSKVLPNLSTYHGSIQTYPHNFDVGVSLHACGEASDWVLRKCLQQKACWVVCSCCCGKLRREALNPYVFQSTGGNEKEIHYPQSKVFASLGGDSNACDDDNINRLDVSVADNDSNTQQPMSAAMFDQLARAADYSELGDVRKPRNACRRAAKSLVEWDRLLFAKECMMCADSNESTDRNYESNTVMTRMLPWEASTKNDVLIGWFQDSYNPYRQLMASASGKMLATTLQEDTTCDVDFHVALNHLFGKNTSEKNHVNANNGTKEPNRADDDQNDWTAQEETDIKFQIEQFLLGSESLNDGEENYNDEIKILKFPTGMGPRKRKLIHCIAESMGLRHWGEGKKDSEKIVAVALRRK
eukprot:CAMPEP_0172326344 /NCGR_PEP_ID=MMETSP1058-20130122/56226_1 /TAXON_ID=83371 /ORGANISM="Detonula confervacea, Strain CCMP 353" /LENGTH=635 /DNA_ID=CAMNT_0013043101 /DNA_START=42 /DNA_END=1949 /DNA_ORIENTATION=-